MRPSLLVERIGPGATVQDGGRSGRMHEGIPPGGALVPALLEAANRSLGNDPAAPALELPLHGARFRAQGTLWLSLDGEPRLVEDGATFTIGPATHAMRYLALPGGIDVPEVLGGRGTLLVAGLGGLEGRGLRRGDTLQPSLESPRYVSAHPLFPNADAISLVLGPDPFPKEAHALLFTESFVVSPATNRVGMRLDGTKLPGSSGSRPFSTPMVRGAMQVTVDGTPIVLGPDHPITGGYPVIAVVCSRDLGRLAQRRPGAPVRFQPDER